MERSSQVGRWTICFDPELTRELYAKISPSSCECTDCANFRAAEGRGFSPPFLPLLGQLGIDPGKPSEICHLGDSGEPMPTQGWFHFVGHLADGADAWRKVGETSRNLDLEPFPGIKGIGFSSRLAQMPEPFEGQPLIQLEFETVVPWVTAVPFA